MSDRFYHPGPWNDACELVEAEAHHLLHVLRAKVGEEIEVFDGRGNSARASITATSRRGAQLRILEVHAAAALPTRKLIIAAAPPKGDRLRWLVEKITELGADEFIPLTTTRSVVIPSEVKLHKLEQTIVGACKQSGRNTLLQVGELCPLAELRDRVGPTAQLCFGQPGTATPAADLAAAKSVVGVIGPEGGLTVEEEAMLLQAGAMPISLGPHVLRVETAAVALATWWNLLRKP